jgi:hypothetical protein
LLRTFAMSAAFADGGLAQLAGHRRVLGGLAVTEHASPVAAFARAAAWVRLCSLT